MLLLIDNYDSFTYNLVHALRALGCALEVVNSRHISAEQCLKKRPSHIVVGPGPGGPKEAGCCVELIQKAAGVCPILGVCLGHQALAYTFNAMVTRAKTPIHGHTSEIFHNDHPLFKGLKNGFCATRYHSLIVDEPSLPSSLACIGWTAEREVMAIAHRELPLFGVQFHPEAILSEGGELIFKNFLES